MPKSKEGSLKKSQSFGGAWTEDKLNRLTDYLTAYMQALKNQPFKKIYVDAFANTGYRAIESKDSAQAQLFLELDEPEVQGFLKGSALRALEIEPKFSEYLFIEINRKHSKELENLKILHPSLADRIQIVNADANEYLKQWCADTDWSSNRAVLFLDPFGMQVEWSVLKDIAETKAIDVWLLFPFVGISRHLTRSEPPPEDWAARITQIMGTDDWRQEFYPQKVQQTLFGEQEVQSKDTDFDRIGDYFVKRLETIFAGVAKNPLPLRNSRNSPLFLLCFAVSNTRGKSLALRIAEHILGKR
jgi:three-Cys-motif partner protein